MAAKDITLYWGSGSPPCWKVMIALEEKKLQGYNQKLMSFEKQEHKSKEVMEINPRGQLPAFKHGNNILNESYGACLYLESQFKSQGQQLIPDSPAEQALVYQRMFEIEALQQKLTEVIYYTWRVPEAERHDSAMKRNKEALTTELHRWEEYIEKMGDGSYIAGKAFSMADVICIPVIAYAFRFGLSQDKYPKLGEYYTLVKERPSVKASWPPHWLEIPQGKDTLKEV